jgi:DNA polymerase-3 subunit gamma/tau
VLETVKGLRRASWILVGQNAQVQDLDASVLRLSFPTAGLVDRFRDHADVVARAVRETLGFDVHVVAVLAGSPAQGGPPPAASTAEGSSRAETSPRGIPSAAEAEASWDAPSKPSSGGASSSAGPASARSSSAGPATTRTSSAGAAKGSPGSSSSAAGRSSGASPSAAPSADDDDDDPDEPPIDMPEDEFPDDPPPEDLGPSRASEPDEPSPDDPLIEGSNLVGAPLVARLLGGTVIEEQVDEPR